jgi:prophage regulatory protein
MKGVTAMTCEVGKGFKGKRLLRESDLIPDIVPFSSSTLWRLVRAGSFPEPVRVSKNIVAWRASDIEVWFNSHTPISERQRRYS